MGTFDGINSITVCSSSKFYDTAKDVARELSCAITVHTPRFDFDEEVGAVGLEDKMRLTREFLEKIDKSDAVYVIAEGGYTGRSVCIEIGFAYAQGKTVILSEPAEEGAIKALTTAIASPDEIADLLGIRR